MLRIIRMFASIFSGRIVASAQPFSPGWGVGGDSTGGGGTDGPGWNVGGV